MSAPAVERNRLAAMLDVDASELVFLERFPVEQLAALRRALAQSTIVRHKATFERMARASSLLPGKIAARIAQDVMGPELIAHLTPFMSPDRAAEISERMTITFQADVATHMVPESSSDLLAALDDGVRRSVTRELLQRKEYAVMGTVVDYLPISVIESLSAEIDTPWALLQVTRFVQDKSRLRGVVPRFDDGTVEQMLELAAEENQMIVLRQLADALDDTQCTRIHGLVPGSPMSVREAWERAASSADVHEATVVS